MVRGTADGISWKITCAEHQNTFQAMQLSQILLNQQTQQSVIVVFGKLL
jgi:invasion protein IalB